MGDEDSGMGGACWSGEVRVDSRDGACTWLGCAGRVEKKVCL